MTSGIHHITAIASDAQATLDFYTGVLGLRLVKKTVNQDDVQTYHLFFGDRLGHPGMDLTFFVFLPAQQGARGAGQVTKISLSVPEGTLEFWEERLTKFQVKHHSISKVLGTRRLVFFDGDDQQLELVEVSSDELDAESDVWVTDEVSAKNAIRSFFGATLRVQSVVMVEPVLTYVFGYELVHRQGNLIQYKLPDSTRAAYLELEEDSSFPPGLNLAGTVHHIAFRAEDERQQSAMTQKLDALGVRHTAVVERFYFKSVYFRVPAGVLFEIATDGPGFTADEDELTLGQHLALPPFLEPRRKSIESLVIPLSHRKV